MRHLPPVDYTGAMTDYDGNTPRLINWNFEPFTAPRPDHTGEMVFTRRWQKLMGGTEVTHDQWFVENEPDQYPILAVFDHWGIPSARQTRVASSLIRWIGTGVGQSFLRDAEKLGQMFAEAGRFSLRKAFAATWAWEVERSPSGDHGAVVRDWLITPETPTIRDYETMEMTCRWLGTKMGQAFITACQRNMEIKNRREMEARSITRSIRSGPL